MKRNHELKMKTIEMEYDKDLKKIEIQFQLDLKMLGICKSIDDIIKLNSSGLLTNHLNNKTQQLYNQPIFQQAPSNYNNQIMYGQPPPYCPSPLYRQNSPNMPNINFNNYQ